MDARHTRDTPQLVGKQENEFKILVRGKTCSQSWKQHRRVEVGGGLKEATAGSSDLTGEKKQRERPDGAMAASLPELSRVGETPRSSSSKMKECSA